MTDPHRQYDPLLECVAIFARTHHRPISIEALIQKEPPEGQTQVPVILLTREVREQQMNEAIQQIELLDSVQGKVTRIRMEHLSSN